MLVEVTVENKENFAALVPERELLMVANDPDCFGIGYTESADVLPDGVLIFRTDAEADDEGKSHPLAELRYIFVAEEARRSYVGTYLFSELIKILEQTDVEAIRCDVPFDEEYNLLCNVLEDYGFHFALSENFITEITLKEIRDLAFLKKPVSKNVVPLKQISPREFNRFFESLVKDEAFFDYELTPYIDDYEPDASMALIEGNRPAGFYLVRRNADGSLSPAMLRAPGNAGAAGIRDMVAGSLKATVERYPEDTIVRIAVHDNRGTQLISRLFPDAMPYITRRGYFYLKNVK